jgi:antitoxin component of RelBE/YafQ-DinJ toxin-antitoxin module
MIRDKQINIRVDEILFERVRKQCEKEGRTMSELMRQFFIEYLEKKENGK